MDYDLDYRNEVATKFNKKGTLPSHAIGTGLLVAPFVAIFGSIDRATSHKVIDNRSEYLDSWSYFGFLVAATTYFLLGVFLYFRALSCIDPAYRFGINLLLVMSTGLTYYSLGRFTLPHVFEFFAFAGTVYSSVCFYQSTMERGKNRRLVLAILVGFFVVLNLWIRPSNINCVLLPFIYLLTLNVVNRTSLNPIWYMYVIVSIVGFLVPYCIFNLYFYDQLYPSYSVAYQASSFGAGIPNSLLGIVVYVSSLAPNILLILFSSEFGILYSNPVIIIGFIGLILFTMTGINKEVKMQSWLLLLMVVVYVGFSFAIVLVWKTTASDYGYRYLFPIIPVAMLFTTTLLRGVRIRHGSWLLIVKRLIIMMSIIGIANVFFYKTTPELSPKDQVNVFGQVHGASVNGYEKNLLMALVDYRTYVLGIGKTYYGLLSAKWVIDSIFVNYLSDHQKEKYLPRFINVAPIIYFQTFLLLGFWIGCGWYVGRQITRESTGAVENRFYSQIKN